MPHLRPTRPRGTAGWPEVLPGGDALDRAAAGDLAVAFLVVVGDDGADVDDALALLARDLGPVVRVGGVGQVLVLLVLLVDRRQEVLGADALVGPGEVALDRQLLGPADDVLDHGSGREVLEVHDLLVPVLVGDLQELVRLVDPVHLGDGGLDHRLHGLVAVAPAQALDLVGVERQVDGEVAGVDRPRRLLVGALDLDLHVEPAGAQDGRVDEVLAVGGADDDDVLQGLDPVDLGQQLRDDGGLHVRADAGAAGAEHRVHLVEEDDDGPALLGLLPGPLEHQADLALGLADVLVQELGALDVEEVALASPSPATSATFLASELATALAMRVFPHPGGP